MDYIIKKESEKVMLDFDEIEQKTNELQTRLQSVGESL